MGNVEKLGIDAFVTGTGSNNAYKAIVALLGKLREKGIFVTWSYFVVSYDVPSSGERLEEEIPDFDSRKHNFEFKVFWERVISSAAADMAVIREVFEEFDGLYKALEKSRTPNETVAIIASLFLKLQRTSRARIKLRIHRFSIWKDVPRSRPGIVFSVDTLEIELNDFLSLMIALVTARD